jgi:hypothetical protein
VGCVTVTGMDVTEVDGAADTSLVSEALELIWGMLDDIVVDLPNQSEYQDSLDRLNQLANLLR